ncbi:MAG: hypothetical protein QGI24_04360, partial [Kiritimatiellia bacterium]|nr:hypothetical protein [Kiritimatiellia bacterium]
MRTIAIIFSTLCIAATVACGTPAGLSGGLVVQLGADDTDMPAQLSRSGRYVVHVLDPDPVIVEKARARLRVEGHYGLASVERLAERTRLPYAENLVNLLIVRTFSPPAAEIFRTVAPGGIV